MDPTFLHEIVWPFLSSHYKMPSLLKPKIPTALWIYYFVLGLHCFLPLLSLLLQRENFFDISKKKKKERERELKEEKMAITNASFGVVLAIVAFIYAVVLPTARADFPAPAPAPTSDGTTIDQGIAYILMLLALALTYLIH